jgi:hypothetical protein
MRGLQLEMERDLPIQTLMKKTLALPSGGKHYFLLLTQF